MEHRNNTHIKNLLLTGPYNIFSNGLNFFRLILPSFITPCKEPCTCPVYLHFRITTRLACMSSLKN